MSVFISYSYADKDYANFLSKSLEGRGIDAQFDVDIPVGGNFSDIILKMIQESNAVIFLVPADSNSSRNALFEVGAAKAMRKKIIALMPHGRQSSARDIAMAVADIILIDVANKSPDEVAELVERVLHTENAH